MASISLAAVDPPHDYGAMCQNCHDAAKWNASSGGVIDNTPINVMCKSCHSAGKGAMPQETHSARTTSSSYWGGDWVNDCTVCHNPHYQKQARMYTGDYPNGPKLVKGTVLSILGNVLTATAPIAATNTLAGQTLMPNERYYYFYRIVKNDGDTITTSSNIDPRLLYGTTTFTTYYGKLVRETIDSGRAITNTSGDVFVADGYRTVKLFNGTGPMSLVPPGDELNPNTNAVCIVCHTRSKRNNIGMAIFNSSFEDDAILNVAGYSGHTNSVAETCWENTSNCHSTPAQGFAQNAATCGTCHGTSMNKAGDTVKMIKNGTNKATYTLVPSIYNHPAHVNRYGTSKACDYCHYQGMVPSKADLANEPNIGDYMTLMQFWVNTPYGYFYNDGTYYGFENKTEGGILNDIFGYEGYSFGFRNSSTACENTYCHGGTLADGSNKTPQWKTGSVACGYCHNATQATPPTSGSHQKHVKTGAGESQIFAPRACSTCHPHDGSMEQTGVHVDGSANIAMTGNSLVSGSTYVNSSSAAVGPVPRALAGFGNCDNLACHGTGSSPRWGYSISANCDACHNKAGDTGGSWSAAHETHVTDYVNLITCNACHSAVAANNTQINPANKSFHVDGYKTVAINTTNYGGSANWDGSSCSSVTCHSSGDRIGESYGYKAQTWAATLNCDGCHKYNATASAMYSEGNGVSNMTDVHVKHVATDERNYKCSECHMSTTTDGTSITTKANHADGSKQWQFDTLAGGGASYNNGSYNCTNVYCHSTGEDTPVYPGTNANWNNKSTGTCGTCHGVNDTTPPGSNMHDTHVATAGGYYFACSKCHNGIVSATTNSTSVPAISDQPLHVDGIQNVVFDSAHAGASATWDGANCSSTYCHSTGKEALPVANLPGAYSGSPYTTVSWSSGSTGCNSCHGKSRGDGRPDYATGGAGNYDANTHLDGSHVRECYQCHYTSVDAANTITTEHVDGTIDVIFNDGGSYAGGSDKGCTVNCHLGYSHTGTQKWGMAGDCFACHGQPPVGDLTIIQPNKDPSGRSADFANAAGLHGYHYTTLSFGSCNYCHQGADGSTNHNPAGAKTVHIGFGPSGVYVGGTYTAKAFANSNFSAAASDGSTTVTYPSGTARTCTNIYCHSDGGSYTGEYSYATPDWDEGGDGTPTYECNICHGTPGGAYVATDMHPVHATTYGYKCYECHTDTVDINNNIIGNHVNGTKQVAFSSGGSYAGRPACSSTYCHSPGNKNAAYDAPESTATWNDTALNCDECHAGNASAVLNTISTNTHLTHIDNDTAVGRNIGCAECHAATVSSDTVVSTTANHVNRKVNIKFDNNINKDGYSPTYNTVTTTAPNGSLRNPGAGTANCNNVYCHSTGNLDTGGTRTYKNISWAVSDVDCDDCHGDANGKSHSTFPNGGLGQPDANSHDKHVDGASAYACQKCHYATGGLSNNPTAVLPGGAHLNGVEDVVFQEFGGRTGTYQADKTCANTYCHAGSNPRWGDPTARLCNSCHDATNNGNLALRHDVHYNSPTAATSLGTTNSPTATAYVFGCGNCHPATHTEGPATTGKQDAEIDGPMITAANYTPDTVTNAVDGKGYNYTVAGQCDNSYCHSDGKGGYYAAPAWNDPKTGGSCDICHRDRSGGAAWTSRHNAHMIGNYSTNANIGCNACHAGTASSDSAIAGLYGMTNHVDGGKDIVFNAWSGGTWTGSNCNSTYCHSDGKGSSHGNINWTSTPNTTCGACHDFGGASTTLSAAHDAHTDAGTYNFACDKCHNQVVNGNSVINTYSMHVNKVKDVDAAHGYGGGNCSSTDCHSTGYRENRTPNRAYVNQAWTGGTLGCTGCHRMADTAANMAGEAVPMSALHIPHVANAQGEYGNENAGSSARGAQAIKCGNCHNGTTTDGVSIRADGIANHVNGGMANVAFNVSDWSDPNIPAGTPSYNPVTKTCSNIYCHSYGSLKPSRNDVVFNTAAWTSPMDGSCDDCHGFPPATGDHSGVSSGCTSCHDHVNGTDDGFKTSANGISLHINNAVEGGGCTGCHGQPPINDGNIIQADKNPSGRLADFANAAGLHDYHYNTTTGMGFDSCAYCHLGAESGQGANHNPAGAKTVHIGFGTSGVYLGGTYTAKAFANTNFSAAASNGSTTVTYPSGTARTCTNIYCHSDGGSYTGEYSYATPNWDVGGDGTPTNECNICHGTPGGAYVTTDRHLVHATTYGYKCNACHTETVDINNNIIGNHVNGTKQVAFSSGGSYAGRPACTTTYCHSDGLDTNYASPQWNVSQAGLCNICHRDKSGGSAPWSGRHNAHMIGNYSTNANIGCNACHAGTASGDSAIAAGYGYTNHVDGEKDVVFNAWSGGSGTGPDCSGTYCHSDGKGTPGGNINWSSTPATSCTACHDGGGISSTLSTAHADHTNSVTNYACDKCHNQVVNGSGVINDYSMHVNKTKNVDAAINYAGGGGACTNLNCHGTSSDNWTTDLSSYDNCTICHGKPTTGANGTTMGINPALVAPGGPDAGGGFDTGGAWQASDPQVGAHQAHLTTPLNYAANVSCSDCHIEPTGVNDLHHIDNSLPAEVYFSSLVTNAGALSPNYTYGGGACTNTYCHGNKMPSGFTNGTDRSPDWNTESYLTGTFDTDCAKCHGFPPKGYSGSHEDMTEGDGSGCYTCHPELNNGVNQSESGWAGGAFATPDWHINGILNAATDCDGCHGYPPVAGDGANGAVAPGGNPDGGKGAHNTVNNSHINTSVLDAANDQYGVSSPGWDECAKCHQNDTHKNSAIVIDIEAEYGFDGVNPAQYLGEWGNSTLPKNCFNVLCHFTKTPRWSAGNDE